MPTAVLPAPVSPTRSVPRSIARPEYVGRPGPARYDGPDVQTPETIERMRVASRIAAQAREAAAAVIAPGVTTDALDAVAHEFMLDHGAYPSTLGYRGYPKSCCTSVNAVTSILTRSPSSSGRASGMPWQMTSLTEVQQDLGKPR